MKKTKISLQSEFFGTEEEANEYPQNHIVPEKYEEDGIGHCAEGFYYYFVFLGKKGDSKEYEEEWFVTEE